MKKLFTLAFLLVAAFNVQAQLLWKISGNGTEKPSYIFGTHHVAPISIIDSIPGIIDALNSCSYVYCEIEVKSDQEMKEMAVKTQSYMMLPQDSLLDKIMKDEDYQKLGEVIKTELGADIDALKVLKPMAISATLSMVQSQKYFANIDSPVQLDSYMQSLATESNIGIKGFETPEFQAQMLFCTPLDQQVEDLVETINDMDKSMKAIRLLTELYMSRDLDGMYALMTDPDMGTSERELERMMYGRNRTWAEHLKTVLPSDHVFIVVGAGHLPGDDGMIEILRRQGYTVEPIN